MSVVIGIVVGLIVLGKLREAIPRAWQFVLAAARVPVVLEEIVHEFSPNSGSSMRDALNRVEKDVADIKLNGVAGIREAHDRVQLVEIRVTALEDERDASRPSDGSIPLRPLGSR